MNLPSELYEAIRDLIILGFDSKDSMFDSVLGDFWEQLELTQEHFGENAVAIPVAVESAVRGAIETAFAEHVHLLSLSDEPTDCDRIGRAFAALNEQGIVAIEHAALCANDA